LGTMTFGTGGRISSSEDVRNLILTFAKSGNKEIDTARIYLNGETEKCLAEAGISNGGFDIATKVYPQQAGDHQEEKLKAKFKLSLIALNTNQVQLFYLHAPDRATPFEETLKAVNDLYIAGHFKEFGLSNYKSWEVCHIWHICKEKGYVLPTVYQGMYNILTRDVEKELISCLRALGIRFYAYNPLCGGLLSGNYKFDTYTNRYAGDSTIAQRYRQRYWSEAYFKAIQRLKDISAKHSLTLIEVALRWMVHHSVLQANDGVILGATALEHITENTTALEKGPLPSEVVEEAEEAWRTTKEFCETYWR